MMGKTYWYMVERLWGWSWDMMGKTYWYMVERLWGWSWDLRGETNRMDERLWGCMVRRMLSRTCDKEGKTSSSMAGRMLSRTWG